MTPAELHALPEQHLVETGQSDECVYGSAERRHLAETHAEQRGDQVETADGDEPPVEGADDHENGGDDVYVLHNCLLYRRLGGTSRTACIEFKEK
jgi:hypothetical protein